jgi:hypothetical protein
MPGPFALLAGRAFRRLMILDMGVLHGAPAELQLDAATFAPATARRKNLN